MKKLNDFSAKLDEILGKEGSDERNENRVLAMQEYVSESLLKARKSSGLSQEALAKRIGTTKAYVSKIENGRVNPSASVYLALMWELGFSMCHGDRSVTR